MIQNVLVLGGGSAGFLTALALKTRLPNLPICVLRSKEIGIIGVGEGTTVAVPDFLHAYLGIDPARFHTEVRPVWKLGIRFLWGPRPSFDYTFDYQLHSRWHPLPRENGFYCEDDFADVSYGSGLMSRDRACLRDPATGAPQLRRDWGYHLENAPFVAFLEAEATRRGIQIEDDTVRHVEQADHGVAALRLASGRTRTADLFVDCSGFGSLLLGKTLEEPYVSFRSSLFCDRAVVGGWERRAGEPVHPYTTAETMEHGWCWRIDHEHRINRGYVYCSSLTTDADAERELLSKNPLIAQTRLVRFTSGRYRDAWVKNVVATGNASGFVEPLESTSLAAICHESHTLAEVLADSGGNPTPSMVKLYNQRHARGWDAIRRFLALHYKFNTRLDTAFWRECRERTDIAGAEPIVEFYQENGPTPMGESTLLDRSDPFKMEGYLVMLFGQRVPHRRAYAPSAAEQTGWQRVREHVRTRTAGGMPADEVVRLAGSAQWPWPKDFFRY